MIKAINHITFTVSNLDESIAFYTDILGFNPKAKWDRGAYLISGEIWLCLSLGKPEPAKDYSHIAFSLGESEISLLNKKQTSLGLDIWQDNTSEGDSLYVRDPDGHQFELHAGDIDSRLRSLETEPYDGLVWL